MVVDHTAWGVGKNKGWSRSGGGDHHGSLSGSAAGEPGTSVEGVTTDEVASSRAVVSRWTWRRRWWLTPTNTLQGRTSAVLCLSPSVTSPNERLTTEEKNTVTKNGMAARYLYPRRIDVAHQSLSLLQKCKSALRQSEGDPVPRQRCRCGSGTRLAGIERIRGARHITAAKPRAAATPIRASPPRALPPETAAASVADEWQRKN